MHNFYYPYQFSTRIRHSQVSRQATFYRHPALSRLNTPNVYMYTVFFTKSRTSLCFLQYLFAICNDLIYCKTGLIRGL